MSHTPHDTVYIESDDLREGFTAVPNWLLGLPRLSDGAFRLYILLLSYAWQHDRCFPSQSLLAAQMGVRPDAVGRRMRELEGAGLVESRRRGQGQTNLYILRKRPSPPGSDGVPPEAPPPADRAKRAPAAVAPGSETGRRAGCPSDSDAMIPQKSCLTRIMTPAKNDLTSDNSGVMTPAKNGLTPELSEVMTPGNSGTKKTHGKKTHEEDSDTHDAPNKKATKTPSDALDPPSEPRGGGADAPRCVEEERRRRGPDLAPYVAELSRIFGFASPLTRSERSMCYDVAGQIQAKGITVDRLAELYAAVAARLPGGAVDRMTPYALAKHASALDGARSLSPGYADSIYRSFEEVERQRAEEAKDLGKYAWR